MGETLNDLFIIGTGTVSIKVADVNDMPPKFVKEEWTTEVDESEGDQLPLSPILTVTVHDNDENNDFYYTVSIRSRLLSSIQKAFLSLKKIMILSLNHLVCW